MFHTQHLKRSVCILLTIAVLLAWHFGVPSPPLLVGSAQAASASLSQFYGRLPLSFEPNQGQTDEQVEFLARGGGYALFLTCDAAVLSLRRPLPPDGGRTTGTSLIEVGPASGISLGTLRMTFAGAGDCARAEGIEPLPGKSNYFIGNDPSKWHTDVPTYARVRFKNVYPGVDLIYYGKQHQLEYDFVVAPGGDPRIIRLAFEGNDGLRIDDEGNLILNVEGGSLTLRAPVVYQDVRNIRQEVAGRYIIESNAQVSFQIGDYDPEHSLVIDPLLSYSTYLGGSGADQGLAVAVDSSGSAYVTGYTSSINFPVAGTPYQPEKSSSRDSFVTKLEADGTAAVYSTFLGGSGSDTGYAIVVDSSGNAYVTGETFSADFPIRTPAFQKDIAPAGGDAFVTKLNATGSSLVYSTYLGGTGNDAGRGIALDSTGSAWVSGFAGGSDFPVSAGAIQLTYGGLGDAFVTGFASNGRTLKYSTYQGGSGIDEALAIAVDASDHIYVTGSAASTDFPTSAGAYDEVKANTSDTDAFVVKLNSDGSRVYATYLGGSDTSVLPNDSGLGIAADSSGSAYVTGRTAAPDFPTTSGGLDETPNGGEDAFITKLTPSGSSLEYSTLFGTAGADTGNGIATDDSGNAYVTGAVQGGADAFAIKVDPVGANLIYNIILGGSGLDQGIGIAVDDADAAYITGYTLSNDFTTMNPMQPNRAGNYDAFVAKIRGDATGTDCNGNGVSDDEDISTGTSFDCNGTGVPDECELTGDDCNGNGIPDECELTGNDCNGSGFPDDCELAGNDCDMNGFPDECDLTGNDCNANGTPDSCEPDCNANGLPDDCDVAGGQSSDCNGNGVPDECETDCNANGVPDQCDIDPADPDGDGQVSGDCNQNFKPDECDIASGTSTDCNADGVPDECEMCVSTAMDPGDSIILVPNCADCALPNDHNHRYALSADGRFLAFISDAANLVAGEEPDGGNSDLFVYDRLTGAIEQITGFDLGAVPLAAQWPALSADGRYVVYEGVSPEIGLYVHDRQSGQMEQLDLSGTGGPAGNSGVIPTMSADGRHVAFSSSTVFLASEVFVHDRLTDATTRVSVSDSGEPGDGPSGPVGISRNGAAGSYISADGRHVTFESQATNLVPGDTNGVADIFVHDRDPDGNGLFDEGNGVTRRVSVSSAGEEATGLSIAPSISANGRHIVFESLAPNLVHGDVQESPTPVDTFVHDRDPDGNGIFDEGNGATIQVNVTDAGVPGVGGGISSTLSADGRYVAFHTTIGMVPDKTTGWGDIFIRDRDPDGNGVFDEGNGSVNRVSLTSTGGQGDGGSLSPFLSADGCYVSFFSSATNLVPIDYNSKFDVFLVKLSDGPCTLDLDGDGVDDSADNCLYLPNSNQEDGDGDGAGDACDNCPILANAMQEDCDSDGTGDLCTIANCLPGDPGCGDCDLNGVPDACDPIPAAALPSLTVQDLAGTESLLSWLSLPGACWYDVVQGDLLALQGSGGDFTAATTGCIAADHPGTSLSVIANPGVGQGMWFLVRGANLAGDGTYDAVSSSQAAPRDAQISASVLACP